MTTPIIIAPPPAPAPPSGPKLDLPPDQTSYAVASSGDSLSVIGDSPQGAYRRNLLNNSVIFNLQWICTPEEYAYLAAFYRSVTKQGGQSFLIDLLYDDANAFTTYKGQFLPRTFKLSSAAYGTFTVDAQFEAEPINYDVVNNVYVSDPTLDNRVFHVQTGLFGITGNETTRRTNSTHNLSSVGYFAINSSEIDFTIDKRVFNSLGTFNVVANSVEHSITGGGPSVYPALDSYALGLWSAWADTLLLTAWTGNNLIRVRRSSDDAELDIGHLSDLSLNVAALLAFAGSSSAYLVTAYDQTAHSRHLSQSTHSLQPRVVNAGTYDGFWRWDDTDDYMQTSVGVPAGMQLSIASHYQMRSIDHDLRLHATQNVTASGHNGIATGIDHTYTVYGYTFGGVPGYGNYNSTKWAAEPAGFLADVFSFDFSNPYNTQILRAINGALSAQTANNSWAATGPITSDPLLIGGDDSGQRSAMNARAFAVWDRSMADVSAALSQVMLDLNVTDLNAELREDGSYQLREDGSYELRE